MLILSMPIAFSTMSPHRQGHHSLSRHSRLTTQQHRHHSGYTRVHAAHATRWTGSSKQQPALKAVTLQADEPVATSRPTDNETPTLRTSNRLWAIMHNEHGEPIYLTPRQDQLNLPAMPSKEAYNALFQAEVVDVPLQKSSKTAAAWNRLLETACTAHNSGDYNKARTALQQALPLTEDEAEQATLYAAIGEINWDAHQSQDALDAYRQAAGLAPEQYELRYAQLLVLSGKRRQAISLLEGASNEAIPHAQQTFLLGTLHEELGEAEQALKYLSEAARLQPNSADVLYNLGLSCELTGQMDRAHEHYQQALKLEPNAPDILQAYERTSP
jgi:tetratricopeptide (TPR) repeat protein